MAEIKKISTELQLLDKFLDTSGDAGTSGQVLTSTGTGINWVSGGSLPGGPYLPLSAGASYPLTNSLYLENTSGSAGASPSLYFKNGSGNFWRYLHESGGDFSIKEGTATRLTFKAGGNVGIGTTAPPRKLSVETNDTATYSASVNASEISIARKNSSNTAGQVAAISLNATGWSGSTTGVVVLNAIARQGNFSNADFAIQNRVGGNFVETFRITTYGNVGIGTDDPIRKLDLIVDATTDAVRIKNTNSNGGGLSVFAANGGGGGNRILTLGDSSENVKVAVIESGNVGIGTTTPGAKLHVDSSTAFSLTAATGDTLFLSDDTSTSELNGVGASIGFSGPQAVQRQAAIAALRTGDDHDKIGLAFYTHPGDGNDETIVEKLRIDHDGNVGIGTTTPSALLEVRKDNATIYDATSDSGQDSNTATVLVSNDNVTTNTFSQIAFHNKGSNRGISRIVSVGVGAASTDLAFVTESNNTKAEKMRITSTGNVGIGTTSPSNTLDVNGGAEINGETYIRSTSNVGLRIQTTDQGTGGSDGLRVGLNGTHAFVWNYENSPLSFGTNGSQKATILANGNVGIGTTSPSYGLDVNHNAARIGSSSQTTTSLYLTATNTAGAPAIATQIIMQGYEGRAKGTFYTDSGVDGEWFNGVPYNGSHNYWQVGFDETGGQAEYQANSILTVRDNGNVGIGTTTPSEKLHVYHATTNILGYLQSGDADATLAMADNGGSVRIQNTSGNLRFLTGGTASTSGSNTSEVMRITSSNVGIGTTSPLEKLHVAGKINSSNNIVSNSTYTMFTGRSSRTVDDYGGLNKEYFKANLVTPGASTTGESSAHGIADLRLQLANNAGNTNMSDIMTLRSGGNVGIGTTTPREKLDVDGDIVTTWGNDKFVGLQYQQGAAYQNGLLLHGDNRSTGLIAKGGTGSTPYIWFGVSEGGNTERMRITKDGNIGIGNTAPAQRLHVAGNQVRLDTAAGGYYLHNASGTFRGAFHDNGTTTNIFGDGNGSTPALSIESNNVTFAGDVTVETGINLESGTLIIKNATSDTNGLKIFQDSSDASKIHNNYNGTLQLGVNNTTSLTLSASQNATFAGNVTLSSTAPILYLANTTSSTGKTWRFSSAANGNAYITQDGVIDAITLSHTSGNATFAGNVAMVTGNSTGKFAVKSTGVHPSYDFYNNGTSYFNGGVVVDAGLSQTGSSTSTFAGDVGIGTTSPTHKLHVNGDMRLTGALRDSNNAPGSAGQVLSSTGSATDWIPLPATPTIYTPKVYNLNNSTNINSQGQKLVPDFGTLEIEGNTTIQQVSGSDTDFQVTDENTGIYEVTYAVFYKNTGSQRTPLGTYLTLNGTAVNGSLMVNYVRSNVAGGGNFSSCTNTFYVNVTDASHAMALCVRRADSSTAPSGISMVEPTGMAVKSTISFRRIS